jgi:FkbM family methyltransferase
MPSPEVEAMAQGVMSGSGLAFVPVAIAGAPTVHVCIDRAAGDPVAAWFADHDWIDEPVQRAFLELIRRGSRVLDLGCHLGTFSLAASALGADVLAVDAAPAHVELLRRAAHRNGFDGLRVVHAAVADEHVAGTEGPGVVPFIVRGIHGHVHASDQPSEEAIEVPVASVDQLLELVGWDDVDVVKMDVEGSEVAALRGMRRLFDRGARPAMVLESNASMLELFDSSVVELRSALTERGFELLLIDHLHPGVLVETEADTVQTECVSDILALTSRPAGLAQRWRIERGLTREATVARVLDAAASPAAGYRRAAADLLRHGPPWLRDAPGVAPAVTALEHDVAHEVRAVGVTWHGSAFDYLDTPEPQPGGIPEGVAVLAQRLSFSRPDRELEHPPGTPAADAELVLREVSFHVNRGESVAVLASGDAEPALRLLSVLAGRRAPVTGRLLTAGAVVVVSPREQGLEPALSVAENAVVLGTSAGARVAAIEARLEEVLRGAGLREYADAELQVVGAQAAARLCLAVALECTRPAVLLVGDAPGITDPEFLAWARDGSARLRAGGTAIVQLVGDATPLLCEPGRALWLEQGELRAAGHARSVMEETRLQRLGFASAPGGWTEEAVR